MINFRIKSINNSNFDLFVIIISWIIIALLIGLGNNFPLNDDWLYAKSVMIFMTTFRIELMDIISMSLLSNIVWGSFFVQIFGFSFDILRISTIIFSSIGILSFHLITKKIFNNRTVQILLTLLFAFNPIYFSLSLSFMSDNLFITFVLLSLLFYIKYLDSASILNIIWATLFITIATLSRQIGLFLPIGVMLTSFIMNDKNFKFRFWLFLPFIFSLLSYIVFYVFLQMNNSIPSAFSYHTNIIINSLQHPQKAIFTLSKNIFYTIYDIGFFCIPLLPILLSSIIEINKKYLKTFLCISLLIIFQLIVISLNYHKLPFFWNNISTSGIGSTTTLNLINFTNLSLTNLSPVFWYIISLFSAITGTFMITIVGVKLKEIIPQIKAKQVNYPSKIFIILIQSVLIYWVIFGLSYFFDRYFLVIFPFLLYLLISQISDLAIKLKKLPVLISFFLLILYSGFTLLGTMDYLKWNNVRWQALNYLTNVEKISPDKIDGGYEFNGWYCFQNKKESEVSNKKWWVRDNEYIVNFGFKKGYSIYKIYPVQRYILPVQDKLYILKRDNS